LYSTLRTFLSSQPHRHDKNAKQVTDVCTLLRHERLNCIINELTIVLNKLKSYVYSSHFTIKLGYLEMMCHMHRFAIAIYLPSMSITFVEMCLKTTERKILKRNYVNYKFRSL